MTVDWKQEAARLAEKIYAAKGSNQVNEVQKLLMTSLQDAFDSGYGAGAADENRRLQERLR